MAIKVHSDNLIFLNNLNRASDRLATAMGRLSTGARVQSAGDDAAGFMISKGLEVSERGLATANNNIQMGMSLLGIAEGSIQTMLSSLYRVRDLALESSNGIYSADERKAMQMEVDSLFDEIVRTKNTTEFNGVNLFGQQIYKDKSETFIDNETTETISLLSYTPSANSATKSATSTTSTTTTTQSTTTIEESQGLIARTISENKNNEGVSLLSANPTCASARSASNLIEGTLTLSSNKTKTLSFGDKVYTFKDSGSGKTANTCSYSYNADTGRLTISDVSYMDITAGSGQEDDLVVKTKGGWVKVYAGDMDDRIEISGDGTTVYAYGGDGNDTLIGSNTGHTWTGLHGEAGDDIIYLNKSGGCAYGESGNDTFYINGNNNTIFGGADDDNFIVSGSGNFIQGGAGTNTITDNGTNTGYYNISGLEDHTPLSGNIIANENYFTLKFGNQSYTVRNLANSLVTYSYDTETQTVTFGGSCAEINAASNQISNVKLNNSYITYQGGSGGQDNVEVNSRYCKVKLSTGQNTVTSNAYSVAIFANGGNDTFNINADSNWVSCASSESANVVVNNVANNIINGGGE